MSVKNQGLMSLSSKSGNRRAIAAPPKKVGAVGAVAGRPQLASWMNLAFDEQYTDRRMLWDEVNTGGWRPHAMGQPCDRISVLSMLGYRGSPIDSGLRRIFDMGHQVESQWRRYFTEMGVLINSNMRVSQASDPKINGEYDILIRHASEPDRRLLGDIKSINNNGFSKLPKMSMDAAENQAGLMSLRGTQIYQRCRGYVMQLQVYMRLAGVQEGFLLFSNKDNSNFADYYLVQDHEMVEGEFARLRVRDTYRERLTVPPCSCEFPPKQVEKKPFELCWFKTEEEIEREEFKNFTVKLGLT